MPRYTKPIVIRALLGALILLWLAAQVATLAHQVEVEKHPTNCDWCLTHASIGHALGAMPPVLSPTGPAPLALALVLVVVAPRCVSVYRCRAPPR
jgi:hypothetical protein